MTNGSNTIAAPEAVEDAGTHLSRVAAEMNFSDLSEAEIVAAKAGILDTLGVCLAATGTASSYLSPVQKFLEHAAPGDVPGLTLGRRFTWSDAILWFGALSHTLDFDDVAGYCHPSAPAVCAALPVAHDLKSDGRQLIVAVALGQDMVIRLAQSVRRPISEYGWLPSIPGVLGAAVTTAKLLGLDTEQTQSSLGLALHQTSGTMQAIARPGSAYRAIREGFNAKAGALSAYLAKEGMPGDDASLEGQYGYFNQFFKGDYDVEFLRASALLGPITSFKPWPCAGHPQLFLTALPELVRTGQVRPDDISKISIRGCSDLLPHQCEPLEFRAAPAHSIDAKVSIPFLIGKILRHGALTIDDFSQAGLRDEPAIKLGRLVEWSLDPSLERGANGYGIGVVDIEHHDGTRVHSEVEYPLGHPDNPLTWEQIVQKFHQCVESSAVEIGPNADRIVAMIEDLENLPSAGDIMEAAFTEA